jgi:hypothetical protein
MKVREGRMLELWFRVTSGTRLRVYTSQRSGDGTRTLPCIFHYATPSVRAVVLIRFGERHHADRSFEAVGILYRRRRNGRPYVADVVSFGTALISIQTLRRKLPDVRALHVLHIPRRYRAASPINSLPRIRGWRSILASPCRRRCSWRAARHGARGSACRRTTSLGLVRDTPLCDLP